MTAYGSLDPENYKQKSFAHAIQRIVYKGILFLYFSVLFGTRNFKNCIRIFYSCICQPLSTGSVLTYIMTTSDDLGDLQHLRIWHDDSPEDPQQASWYLTRVVFEDIHRSRK
jgi:hypothetical protein